MPLVAVAAQLVNRLGQRFRDGGALAFHHHKRNAVHQQHQVRHDEGLTAVVARWAIHTVLVNDRKAVVLGRVPVDKADGLAASTVPAGQAIDGDAQQQQFRRRLVGLDKLGARNTRDRGEGLCQAFIIQPGHERPIDFAQVDFGQLLAQHAFLNDFGEAATPGNHRVVNAALDVRPAQTFQLRDERLFYVFKFPSHIPALFLLRQQRRDPDAAGEKVVHQAGLCLSQL